MWILTLEWLLLAFCVLWGIGAAKRLKRLRAQCKSAFATVEAQCAQVLDLQRSCARLQALKEQVTAVYVQHAQEVLLPSAAQQKRPCMLNMRTTGPSAGCSCRPCRPTVPPSSMRPWQITTGPLPSFRLV